MERREAPAALIDVRVGAVSDLADPGCREFSAGEGDWPFRGFVVRQGEEVFAYQNYCVHAGHPLNWTPGQFLTKDGKAIVCASHGARYAIDSGRCVAGPCRGDSLRRVECDVREGDIWVRVPDRAPA